MGRPLQAFVLAAGATLVAGFASYFALLSFSYVSIDQLGRVYMPADAFAVVLATTGIGACLLFAAVDRFQSGSARRNPGAVDHQSERHDR